ncbi:pyruvate synthase [Thermosipho melanesiensis]|uniref:Pyruvate/ketoisovalerate oxidoreductase, gamma subunit n=2 Tax=Thermosipho melanesiensis TaxID=46541 RepID=A6LJV9_THEM4|nr:2-oxoacid:acceptor oxidoreductase family protein [Thermosipho melanesiensis]ABR30210.1 pyruvate/ketoisovalerate oxidoreductase, gamma subunit [Thermosipho melanesiensis BI429]APT73408.1 pyruvate synthase [Thermosipho melanesiensis]OOC38221.1 pyruvate synthase [Thermosipho melanesiensis]OOC40050.1 pyruvate synthase [Thermosipho melanesiensis]OOC40070.1 pyruvate synthase [Thermosipho melanesiensis]
MPAKYFEIRWHARAGQGAKSASQMLAEAALEMGKYVQSFPEYGAERTGAPMKAFNRVSDEPILIHSSVDYPDVVVIIDDTMLGQPALTDGTDENTVFIVNTVKDVEYVREKLGVKGKICTIAATDIALEELKRGIPNTVMLGAIAKVTGVITLESAEQRIRKAFSKKFPEELVEANVRALRRGFEEVKCNG